jgi:hypothetical protein
MRPPSTCARKPRAGAPDRGSRTRPWRKRSAGRLGLEPLWRTRRWRLATRLPPCSPAGRSQLMRLITTRACRQSSRPGATPGRSSTKRSPPAMAAGWPPPSRPRASSDQSRQCGETRRIPGEPQALATSSVLPRRLLRTGSPAATGRRPSGLWTAQCRDNPCQRTEVRAAGG